eukprot:COSAG02_NODE_1557_length_11939_cov_343.602872_11_plen_186_part_00
MLARFPLLEKRVGPPAACISIVEVNTLILVLQRHFGPWLLGTSTAAVALRPGMFYLYWSTYVAIRLVLHPYILYVVVTEYTRFMGAYDAVLVALLLVLLCIFNVGLLGKQLSDHFNGVPLPGSPRKREDKNKHSAKTQDGSSSQDKVQARRRARAKQSQGKSVPERWTGGGGMLSECGGIAGDDY